MTDYKIDVLIAVHVLGMIRTDVPKFTQTMGTRGMHLPFPRSDCALFREHPKGIIQFSTDFGAHSGNDMFFRNGLNEKDGIADPLPHYSDDEDYSDFHHTWEVVNAMNDKGFDVRIETDCGMYTTRFSKRPGTHLTMAPFTEQTSQRCRGVRISICKAALKALGVPTP